MQIMHVSDMLRHHSDAPPLQCSANLTNWLHRNGDDGNNKITVDLVDEHTTLRRHMASKHKVSKPYVLLPILNSRTLRVSIDVGASQPNFFQ